MGMFRLDANFRWHQEAEARGLRDPWSHRPDRPLRTEEIISLIEGTEVKGTKVIYPQVDDAEMVAWKSERDEYMRQRDEWIAMEVFHEYGYDAFLAETANLSAEFRNNVRPCDSRNEPQCNLYCPKWDVCDRR